MKKDILNVNIYAFAESEGDLWFIPHECNALCRYNKEKKNIDYMTVVVGEEQMPTLYSNIVVYEKYLVLVPYMASEVAIFDTDKLEFEKLKLPEPDCCYKYRENAKFYRGIKIGELLYLLPGEFPEIVCINMKKRHVETANIWYPLYGEKSFGEMEKIRPYKGMEKYACSDVHELYITFYAGEKGKIGKFSFETHEIEIFTIDGVDAYFSCIENYGDELYLVTRSGQILCWNKKSKKVVRKYLYETGESGIKRKDTPYEIFVKSILYDNKIYLFWADKPQYTEFDLDNHKMKTHLFQYIDMPIRELYFSEENSYFLTNESNSFYQWIDGEIKKYSFGIRDELLEQYFFKGYFQKNIYFKESNWFNLKKMLPILSNIKSVKDKVCTGVGKTIYHL